MQISRSIGDICAKHLRFGGNPQVLIALPEIKGFPINLESDFVVLGCSFLLIFR